MSRHTCGRERCDTCPKQWVENLKVYTMATCLTIALLVAPVWAIVVIVRHWSRLFA